MCRLSKQTALLLVTATLLVTTVVSCTSTTTPLDWLRGSPFETAPSEPPETIATGLPEGFNALEPHFATGELPSGRVVQRMGVEYQRPIGGQVYVEDSVQVELFGYDSSDARTEHLDLVAAAGYEWNFEEVAGHRVARYHDIGVDGRIWVSGPYLIVIYSGLDTSERGPWVDDFTQLYLERFPLP